MNEYYVYAHFIDGESLPFYIGKGKGNRAYDTKQRSKFWQRKAKNGFKVEFIAENLLEVDALSLECEQIKKFGRRDIGSGCLVNLTDGGDGLINPSDEVRAKIGAANKERFKDAVFREKFGAAQRMKVTTEKTRKNMRNGQIKRFESTEERDKFSKIMMNIWSSSEIREKHSNRLKEVHENDPEIREKIRNYRLGKTLSDESRRLVSLGRGGKSFILISPLGVEYECIYQSEFARIHDLNVKSLNSLLRGKTKTYRGWKLKPEKSV